MTNAQPPPLPAAGLPLPRSAELPDRLPGGGARRGDPPEFVLTAGAGLADGGGWDTTGAALAGDGTGTDETCDTCET
jgi:hypothetical protein